MSTVVRLGRREEFDERSRNFPIRELVAPSPRSYTWRILPSYVIDQGQEGACVGFAVANELIARPAEVDPASLAAAQQLAQSLYCEAQSLDPWPGGSRTCGLSPHYEGTSVLAGMKAAHRRGYFAEYRWAFSLEDVVLGVGRNGPAVIGVNWYESMFNPAAAGFVFPSGQVAGGHAVLVRAVKVVWEGSGRTFADLDLDRSFVTFRNSWGPSWGHAGDGRLTLADLGRLLGERGEAVFAVGRRTIPR